MKIALYFSLLLTSITLSVGAGCAQVDTDGDADGDADSDGDVDADGDGDSDGDADGDADADEEPIEDVVIYAHSSDTLFLFSPEQNEVISEVPLTLTDGSPAENIVDLAVNRVGEVYVSGYDSLFQVDPDTGVTTLVGDFVDEAGRPLDDELDVRLYALTFVPAELYPGAETDEVLIGADNAGVCYEVDPSTAVASLIGQYPSGWASSGDLVSVDRLGITFATLREVDGDYEDPDYLTQVSFLSSGEIAFTEPRPLLASGGEPFRQIFGLGYWGSTLFGFSNTGELITIDRTSGAAAHATDDTGAESFWGAGVTTQVPVVY